MSSRTITILLGMTLIVANAVMTSACSVMDGLELTPDTPKKKKRLPPGELPPPVIVLPTPGTLPPAGLARRIALDLGLTLPKASDVETLVADSNRLPILIGAYLESSASSVALSQLHPRIWGLDENRFPDLDRMIADNDSTLATALTKDARKMIVDEPALMLRYVLEQHLPFTSLFTASFSIQQTDGITLWNMNDEGSPWSGEPYRFGTFSDGRPTAGLLVSPAFMASFSANGDPNQRPRARRLLTEFACQPFESSSAHLFYDLTGDELAGDLEELAKTRTTCAGCHMHFNEFGAALSGLADATTFDAWKTYVVPEVTPSGFYAGQEFNGLAELATKVGNDPRVHRCEIERLTSAILQRPLNDRDKATTARALDAFYASNFDLKAAARKIFESKDFSLAPLAPSLAGTALYEASGVHVMRRSQWQAMVQELVPGTTSVDFPSELDPGSEETVTSSWMVPTGTYWHVVDRVARQAASAIVAADLADDSLAVNRRVLKNLPDGSGYGADVISVYAQIRAIWGRITGEDLQETSQTYTDFQTLWTASEPNGSAEDFRRAWRTILVAMLTHPKVITY